MHTKAINCVWVVDDDPLQVLILNRLLTPHQLVAKTRFFSGAKSAIDTLGGALNTEDTPDLIFLDLVMPRGDGWDFLDHYRKLRSKLSKKARIVVISSFSEESQKRLKVYPEVTDLLGKPIDRKQFDEVILHVVGSAEA